MCRTKNTETHTEVTGLEAKPTHRLNPVISLGVLILCAVILGCITSEAWAEAKHQVYESDSIQAWIVPPQSWQTDHATLKTWTKTDDKVDLTFRLQGTQTELALHIMKKVSGAALPFGCMGPPEAKVMVCGIPEHDPKQQIITAYTHWLKDHAGFDRLSQTWKDKRQQYQCIKEDRSKAEFPLPYHRGFLHLRSPMKSSSGILHEGWLWLVVLCVVCLIHRLERQSGMNRYHLWVLFLVSLSTRAIVPHLLLHIQTDDLQWFVVARDGVSAYPFADLHSPPLALFLLRWIIALFGNGLDSAFHPGFVFGVLFPVSAFWLAWRYYGSQRIALLVGLGTLLSPVAWMYSGGITKYLPMAVLFCWAVVAQLWALSHRHLGWKLLASGFSVFFLGLALCLKQEFIILAPAYLLILWGRMATKPEDTQSRWDLFLPVLLAGIALLGAAWMQTGQASVPDLTVQRVARTWHKPWFHVALFLGAWLLLNPPFLPFKLLFLASLRKPVLTSARPWQVLGIAFSLLFVLSSRFVGLNQWRHSLLFMVPMYMASVPFFLHWWPRTTKVLRLGFIALLLIAWGIGYGIAFEQMGNNRQQSQALLQGMENNPKRLVVYIDHPSDLSAEFPLLAANRTDAIPLTELFSSSCPAWSNLAMTYHLSSVDESTATRMIQKLRSLKSSTAPLEWTEMAPKWVDGGNKRFDYLLKDLQQCQRMSKPECCRLDLPAMRTLLKGYDEILLFVDAAWIGNTPWFNHLSPVAAEHLWDVVCSSLDLESRSFPNKPALVPVRRIADPLDPEVTLWEAKSMD